jgi:hypothetical protein
LLVQGHKEFLHFYQPAGPTLLPCSAHLPCCVIQLPITVTEHLRHLNYKGKKSILAHSFGSSSLGFIGPIALGLWQGTMSWWDLVLGQNWLYHEPRANEKEEGVRVSQFLLRAFSQYAKGLPLGPTSRRFYHLLVVPPWGPNLSHMGLWGDIPYPNYGTCWTIIWMFPARSKDYITRFLSSQSEQGS